MKREGTHTHTQKKMFQGPKRSDWWRQLQLSEDQSMVKRMKRMEIHQRNEFNNQNQQLSTCHSLTHFFFSLSSSLLSFFLQSQLLFFPFCFWIIFSSLLHTVVDSSMRSTSTAAFSMIETRIAHLTTAVNQQNRTRFRSHVQLLPVHHVKIDFRGFNLPIICASWSQVFYWMSSKCWHRISARPIKRFFATLLELVEFRLINPRFGLFFFFFFFFHEEIKANKFCNLVQFQYGGRSIQRKTIRKRQTFLHISIDTFNSLPCGHVPASPSISNQKN